MVGRDGQRMARLFRQVRELGDNRACDLDSIAHEDEIEIVESRCRDPGYTACLMRAPAGCPGGLISLAPGQDRGRRRFSIAHEFGHYHIPKHARFTRTPCAERDLRARSTDARQAEWEANDFAAELLMPTRLFSTDVDGREPSFELVARLASPDFYDVSFTAAAWRLVQTTSEACALVVTSRGTVEWIARSTAFRYRMAERRQRIRPGTAAAAVLAGEAANPALERVEWHTWLDREPDYEAEVWESTHAIPSLGQVLSLVWVVEEEA